MSLFGCDHGPLIAQLRADLAASEAALEAERARSDGLLDRLLERRAPEPPPATMPQPATMVAVTEPDELKALIDLQAGGDLRKRRMMLAQLAMDRADGVSPDDIAEAIRSGVQGDGVPA